MRKKWKMRILCLGLLVALLCGGLSGAPVSAASKTPLQRYGRLSVDGSSLVDRKGNPVQLKGVSTHGLAWYPEYLTYDSMKYMRDKWGVEVVRLAMYTAEYNGYCTGGTENKKALRSKIYQCVRDAKKLGLYIIIDWHVLSDGNPQTYQKESQKFFRTMAKKYKNEKHVLYEICNEPNGGVTWSQIKSYAKPVIRTIRKYDQHAVILVGTPNWSQNVNEAAADPIRGQKNLMYTLHFYAATHTQWLRDTLKQAHEAGLPVFVTEYGICDASGSGANNLSEAAKWMKLLDQYQISSCIWNLSNKAETCALIRNDCSKKTGWKSKDLTDSGKWFVKMMAKHKK